MFKALGAAALAYGLVLFGYTAYYSTVISSAMKQYAIEFPKSYRINKFGLTLEEQDELRQAEALNASRGYNSYSKSDNVPKPIDDEIRATPLVLGMDYEAQFQKKAKELTSEKAAFTFGSVWILFFVLRYGGLLVRWAYTTSKLE